MKLTTLLIVLGIMQLSATALAQKISLSEKNVPLSKVFKKITTQSGYGFFIASGTLKDAKPVTIEVNKLELNEVLRLIFANQPLNFTIQDNMVLVSPKKENLSSPDEVTDIINVIDVKGKVMDEDNKPLSGATVKLEGKFNYVTITNEFGDFIFEKVPSGDYKVTVSYVGYENQEKIIAVSTRAIVMPFSMQRVRTTLQAVSILNNGYQQISAERATGAFDNIKPNQIQKPATNIAERLIGTTAGLQIRTNADGNPSLQLRGQTTLYANGVTSSNTPLIVVDGFPVTGNASNPFNSINTNDVESITVLKDAAASSIWGARASNGVIVITTKKGRKDTPLKIELSAFTRFAAKQDVGYLTGLASSADAVAFEQLAFNKWGVRPNDGTFTGGVYKVSMATQLLNENNLGFITTDQLNNGLALLKTQDNRKQISDYLLDNPLNTQYNISLSGGGQRISNYVSMMMEKNQTNFKRTDNKKYAINYRTNANLFKWLDFDLSGTFQLTKSNDNGFSPYNLQQIAPYDMLKNSDGTLTNVQQYYQPILERLVPLSKFPYSFSYNPIQEIANRSNVTTNINARIQAGLTFKISDGLTYRSSIQYENINATNKYYQNDQTFYVRNLINTSSSWNQTMDGNVTPNLPLGGILDQSRNTAETYNFRNQLNFSRTLAGKHEINVVAGTEVNNSVVQSYSYPTSYGYNDQSLTVGTFPNGPTGTSGWMPYSSNNFNYLSSFAYRTQRFLSYYTNAAYTYLSKYTISGSYRTDASNLIAKSPKFRYSPFYSLGLGYDLTREAFADKINWLNRLNLRATYGRTGNVDNSTSPYTLITLDGYPNPYTGANTGRITSQGNPTLTWEKTTTLNLGIDYAVLNNRLYGKIDVYSKQGKDLLAQIAVPSVTGSDFASFNNAAISNKGIEITLGTTIPLIENNIIWNGTFTGAYNKSKVTTLFNSRYQTYALVQGGNQAYSQGYDPNSAWAYRYTGIVNGSPTFAGPNGTFLPMDYNNGYRSDDGRQYLQNVGTLNPRYILGFVNNFKIYDFNVSFIITAKLGAVFQSQYFNYPVTDNFSMPNSQLSKVLNADPNKILPLPSDPNDQNYRALISYYRYLNYSYVSADLARLQEVNVSYNIPKNMLTKAKVKSAQLILQGNNLYTWLANDRGEDPEYPKGGLRPRAQFTMGIKVEL